MNNAIRLLAPSFKKYISKMMFVFESRKDADVTHFIGVVSLDTYYYECTQLKADCLILNFNLEYTLPK